MRMKNTEPRGVGGGASKILLDYATGNDRIWPDIKIFLSCLCLESRF